MYKLVRSFFIAVLLLLSTVLIAQAGGWAVITLDDLPSQITAGQTLTLGFIVRQHGKTLRDDLRPLLHFARADTTESFSVTAEREGVSGHYSASVTFPSAGQWNWRVDIEQFGMMTQEMPPLAAQAAPSASAPAKVESSVLVRLVNFIDAIRRALPGQANTAIAPVSLTTTKSVPLDQISLGKKLFSAKGCVMCHTNAAVNAGEGPFYFGDKAAPNLTNVTLSDEYLRQWLKDPAALKPGTYMPDLGLKSKEIEALIAFLKSK